MHMVEYLSITLFALWCMSEIVISLISWSNRSRGWSVGGDRWSYVIVWMSTIPPVGFAYLIRAHPIIANGFGSLAPLFPLLGYVGCFMMVFGITMRLLAVATLKRQFTLHVALLEPHKIIDTGMYSILRHPAYLGHLASLCGIGLVLGNGVGLMALVVLPLAGIVYRIHVEERAFVQHFGAAYQTYARRTKRLLPGIW
ncbi:MAG: isoprenylcysteine carboxylmethyltransferase family protein [Chloroflexales bacterium]